MRGDLKIKKISMNVYTFAFAYQVIDFQFFPFSFFCPLYKFTFARTKVYLLGMVIAPPQLLKCICVGQRPS